MKLTYRDGLYLAICTFEERSACKRAGFTFHPGASACEKPETCPACKRGLGQVWWTKRKDAAARLYRYADESARKELASHMRAVGESKAIDLDIEIPVPKGLAYFGYQKAGIQYLAMHDSVMLCDAMGVGKTIQALGLVNLRPEIKNVLVICPAGLRINWLREAQRWLVPQARKHSFFIAEGNHPVPALATFVIVSYDRLIPRRKSCEACGGEKGKKLECPACRGTGSKSPDDKRTCCVKCRGLGHVTCSVCGGKGKVSQPNHVSQSLGERQWDLIVTDEAHYLKNPDSARTKAVLGNFRKNTPGLVAQGKRKILVTGTPILNKPIEAWPLLATAAPDDFGDYWAYARRYCDAHQELKTKTKKVWNLNGASNLEELQERARSTCMIRRLKEEVLKDLPPKVRQVIPIAVSAKDKAIADKELAEWMEQWGDDLEILQEQVRLASVENDHVGYTDAVSKLEYLQRVSFVEMAHTRHMVAKAKLPYVIEHLEMLLEGSSDKVVCFAHHHDVIEGIRDHFGKQAVALYGPMNKDDRQVAIDSFQADPAIRLFVGSIAAAGVGITLTAASMVCFAELDWTPATVTQAEDRCHRIGAQKCVTVQHLVWDGSLDARMCHLVVQKQEIAERALDRPTEVVLGQILGAKPDFEIPVEPVSVYEKTLLRQALITLATSEGPGGGFSQFDRTMGHKLATWAASYSDRQAQIARKLVRRYRKQLGHTLCVELGIAEMERKTGWIKRPAIEGPSVLDVIL